MRRKVAFPAMVVLLLAAAGVVAMLARGEGPSPPQALSVAARDRNVAEASQAAGTRPEDAHAVRPDAAPANAAASQSTPSRTASTEPGLSGVVLDDLGAPIPGIVVYLRLADSRIAGAEIVCTDGDGYFVFRQAVGRCVLSVENDLLASHELTMALGEWRFVELRATQPCLVVEGYVRQGDGPVANRIVRAKGGALPAVAVEYSDDGGYYQHVLPPGRYVLSVASAAVVDDASGVDVPSESPRPESARFATHELTLNATTRRVRHDFELPCAALRVTVVHALDRRPVANVIVRAAAGNLGRFAKTDAAGVAEMGEMTSGTWRVWAVTAPQTSAAAQEVEIDASARTPRGVTLLVEPAGVIVMKVRSVGGATAGESRLHVMGNALLPLREPPFEQASQPGAVRLHLAGGGVMESADWVEASAWMDPAAGSIVFVRVPPGRHELRCEDRVDEKGCTYAVCEPFRQAVDVTTGGSHTVELSLPRRPWLEVAVTGSDSKFVDVPIQVIGARGPVVLAMSFGSPGLRSGPVVPGDYRIVVEAATGRIEEAVTVGNRDVQHFVRLPAGGVEAGNPAKPR